MKGCPICGGAGVIHERQPRRSSALYVRVPCWACTPQPIRGAA